MSKLMLAAIVALLILAAVLTSGTPRASQAQAATQSAQELSCYEYNGRWDAEKLKCIRSAGVQVEIDYPLELASNRAVMKVLETYFADSQNRIIKEFAKQDFKVELPGSFNNWSLFMSYKLYTYSPAVLSIRFDLSEYTGGAHPNLIYQTFTFETRSGKELALEDVLSSKADTWKQVFALVQADLLKQQGADADAKWIADGTGLKPENYRAFAVTAEGLKFFFAPYQVAPYAAGGFEVTLPWASLKGLLKAPFVG